MTNEFKEHAIKILSQTYWFLFLGEDDLIKIVHIIWDLIPTAYGSNKSCPGIISRR